MLTQLVSALVRLSTPFAAAALAAAVLLAPPCAAQQPTATAIITDRSLVPASNYFSMPPNQFRLTGTGDVVFTSGFGTGLFRWNRATGRRVRLLQTNDPIEVLGLTEELAGSIVDNPAVGGTLQANSAGHLAMVIVAAVAGERDPAGVFVFDGSAYRLVDSADPTAALQVFINDAGKVAFRTATGPLNASPPLIRMETLAGALVDVAEVPSPSPIGGTYSNLQIIGYNNAGHIAFLADIQGVPGVNRAVFLADGTSTPVPLVKSGDPVAAGQTFNLRPAVSNYFFNGSDEVAFAADVAGGTSGIWIARPGGAPVKLARMGEPTGIDGWGNHSGPFTLRGFNGAGQVLFDSNVSSGGGGHALFLKDLNPATTAVVFWRGQATGSEHFDRVQQAALNGAGQVAFMATLMEGSTGWYSGSGAGEPVKIALEGETTPAGGSFGLAGRNTPALINAAGEVVFVADILGLNAVGLFSWTASGGIQPVVTSLDMLPAGSNLVVRPVLPASRGSEALVRVCRAGGQTTFYAKDLKSGMSGLRKIVSEYDRVDGAGTVVSPGAFTMNAKGEVVFLTALLGSAMYPRSGILGSLPASGVESAVLAGDSAPGGGAFTSFSGLQLNDRTELAFFAATNIPNSAGIFVASRASGLQAVVRQNHPGWPWPGGGGALFSALNASPQLNAAGQVAFQGSGAGASGLFLGSAGAAPLKLMQSGESASGGGVFNNAPPTFKLNAAGQVAYSTALSGGGSGVYLAACDSGACASQKVARAGEPAPNAGGAWFAFFREDSVELNNAGQVAFWAGLDSSVPAPRQGWFLWSAGAGAASRLLQQQLLPDGGRASWVPGGSGIAALADSGELAVFIDEVSAGPEPRFVIAGANGVLRPFATSGDLADGTGSQFGNLYRPVVATPSGRFYFGAALVHGPARFGIFRDRPE